MTSPSTSFDDSALKDPSWKRARAICNKSLPVHSNLSRLLRGAWTGGYDLHEMLRILSFSGTNPNVLLKVAGIHPSQGPASRELLEESITRLGIRLSGIVLSISYTVQCLFRSDIGTHWRSLLQETMNSTEIGSIFGTKVVSLGSELGTVLGFGRYLGQIIMMAYNKDYHKACFAPNKPNDPALQIDRYGCESYQVGAFGLQELGFGADVAMSLVLAAGNLHNMHIEVTPQLTYLRGAFLWIDALHLGRNYPAEVAARSLFPEITPPREQNARNQQLESLHAEISRVRSKGSSWTWHLPFPSYEETMEWITAHPSPADRVF
ncbi:MAG: hypothetical protein QY326_07370 [Bdellovibrionota bacterium]|nr:MAG: hypothetical protein QY326_07370 [Bdellovibrionota bacterium]